MNHPYIYSYIYIYIYFYIYIYIYTYPGLAGRRRLRPARPPIALKGCLFAPSLLLSSLELSDTTIYEPLMRALLGTAAPFCRVVVLKLKSVVAHCHCVYPGSLRALQKRENSLSTTHWSEST